METEREKPTARETLEAVAAGMGYRECLAIALKLQVGLGAANLERLQEAAREF